MFHKFTAFKIHNFQSFTWILEYAYEKGLKMKNSITKKL